MRRVIVAGTMIVASLVAACSTSRTAAEEAVARHVCLHESPSIPFVVGDTSTLQIGPVDDKDSLCLPRPAGGAAVAWKSSNPAVASIDTKGFFQALAPGKTEISIEHDDSRDSASFTVLPPIRDVRIVPDSITLSIGDSATFRIVTFGGPPSAPVWWYSADPVVSFGNPSSRAPLPVSVTGETVTVWASQPGAAILEAGTRYLRDAAHVRVVVR